MTLCDCINIYARDSEGNNILLCGEEYNELKMNFLYFIRSFPKAGRHLQLAAFSKKKRVRKKNLKKLSELRIDVFL